MKALNDLVRAACGLVEVDTADPTLLRDEGWRHLESYDAYVRVLSNDNRPVVVCCIMRRSQFLYESSVTEHLRLTKAQLDVAALLCERKTNKEIARELGISAHTVRHHVEGVLLRLGAADRNAVWDCIAGYLIQSGELSPDSVGPNAKAVMQRP